MSITIIIAVLGISCVMGFAVFVFGAANYAHLEKKIFASLNEYANSLYRRFELMFWKQSLQRCYLMIVIGTALVALLLFFSVVAVLGPFWSLPAAAAGGFLGFKAPGLIMDFLFKRRVAKFDEQLVDVLNMMANSLKSGLSLMQVVSVIEKEMPDPAREEFRLVIQENRLGVTLDDALMNLANRVPSDDLYMVVSSIVTLREQGGDLTETFDTIASTIRERQKIKGKIRTLTAQGIFQTGLLTAFPFFILVLMYLMQPNLVQLMWTTPVGLVLIALMLGLQITGALVMKKILTIDI